MYLAILAVFIGFIALMWSANTFIDGATQLAIRFNMPSFLVGVLILGIGSSSPEMVVSALSALKGSPELALGNAYGSNIINICLVLGATALISPIPIKSVVVRHDMTYLLLVTALAAWQLMDGALSQLDGLILIFAMVLIIGTQIWMAIHNDSDINTTINTTDTQLSHLDPLNSDVPCTYTLAIPTNVPSQINTLKALFRTIIGLVLLIGCSRTIVWGAVELATLWGMSELLIGLTIISIGTSLPELVTSITAARHSEHEMALGNIIGSNLFNTLGVVGLAALIKPMHVDAQILQRDMLMVGIATMLLYFLSFNALRGRHHLERSHGVILICGFVAYSVWLAMTIIS